MGFNVVHREVQPCYCEKPSSGCNTGDVIQCDKCNEYWRCTGLSDGGMQWDPSPRVLRWERVKQQFGFRHEHIGWEVM